MILYPLPMPGDITLHVHMVPFVQAEFDPLSFDTAGIACPPSIARSAPKRQAEFFFGRLAARAALQDFGATTSEVLIGAGREPVWPAHVVGSISHIDGLAGAVVGARTRHGGLGIDLVQTAAGESQAALRTTIIDADELSCLHTAAGALTLDELVTLVFSTKESLYKAAYGTVGCLFGFEAARVETVDVLQGIVTLVLTHDLHPQFARGRRCDITFARLDKATFITAFEAGLQSSGS